MQVPTVLQISSLSWFQCLKVHYFNSKGSKRWLVVFVQNAGNAVKRATEVLVREAQKVKEWTYEETVTVDQRMVTGMAQVRVLIQTFG